MKGSRARTATLVAATGMMVLAGALDAAAAVTTAPARLHEVQASPGDAPITDGVIAVDPAHPQRMLVGAGNVFSTCTGGGNVGMYSSSDGGRTWTHACMTDDGPYFPLDGPAVAYDIHGTAYMAATYGHADEPVEIERSSDNGATWSQPAVAVPAYYGYAAFAAALEADLSPTSPRAGSLYLAALQDDNGDVGLTVSRSKDGGASWKTTLVVPASPQLGQPDLAVGRDGTLYLTYLRCGLFDGESCTSEPAQVMFSASTDGGVTWSAASAVAKVRLPRGREFTFGKLPHTKDQANDAPSIAIDNTGSARDGRLYVAATTRSSGRLLVEVVSSSDGGATWDEPVFPATPGATGDQFLPWLSVSATGTVGVTWLDRRNDPRDVRYEPFMALSTDGGASFGTNHRLASVASNPRHSGWPIYLSWHAGNAWAGDTLYAVWPDTRTGEGQVEVGWR